jgi:RNA polymerase sigma-70 factor (ECF subfamily)
MLLSRAETMISPTFRKELDASDLVQQTLMEAHCHAEKLSGIGSAPFFVWLKTALKHNVLDAVKHLKTQKHDWKRRLRISERADSFDRVENELVANQTSPSQIVQRNEQISILLGYLQELPSNQRKALSMKHLQGSTLKEIAEALCLSESAVAGLLHRGREQLVALMEVRGQH